MSWLVAPLWASRGALARARARAARPGWRRRDPRRTAARCRKLGPVRLVVGVAAGRARESALRVEHRREPRLVRDGLAERRRNEDRPEGRQCAKKTVWPSPCMRISNRKAPSSASATSVGALRVAESRQDRVGRVRLRLVREVDPRQLVLEEPTGEDEHVEARRLAGPGVGLGDDEREATFRIRSAPPPAAADAVPELDHPVRDRSALPVDQLPDQLQRRRVVGASELVLRVAREADRVERSDRLRRRARQRHQSFSSGVVPEPPRPSTMSHW